MRKSLNIGLFNVGSIFETQVEILVEDNPLPVTNVQVKLTVPPGVSLADSHLPVGSYNPALEVWTLGSLPPNTHIEGSFTWQVDDINEAPYVFDFHMSATGCVKCFSDNHFQIYAFGFTCQDIQPCFVGGGGGGITLADVDDWLGDIGSIADPNTGAQNVMVRNFANPAEKTVLSYDQIFTASPTFSLRLAGATPVLSFGVGTGKSSIIPVLPTYPDFLAVDADAQLPDFSLFRIQGDATVYQKLPGTTTMPHADVASIGDIDDVDLSGALVSDMVLAYDSTTKTWKPKINPGAITPISVNVANLGTDTITFEITGGPAQGPGIIPAFQVYLNDGTDYTVNGAGLQIGTGSTANTVAAQLATALENDVNNNVFGTQATVNVNGPLVTLSIPGKLITTLSLPTGAVPGTGLGGGGTQIKSINDVPDVDVTGPVNGELLVWDAPLGAWVNKDVNKPPVATGLSYSITGTGTNTLTITILGNAATDSGVFPALVLTDGTNTINVPEVPFATGTSFAKLRDDIKAAIDAVTAGWIGGVTATGRDVVIQSTGSLFTTPDQAVTTIMPPPILTLASLSDIGDVDTTGVSDTNIIQYDAATQTWVVRDIKGASQGTGVTATVSGTGTDTLQIAVTGGPATNPGQIGPFTITDGINTLQIPEVYFTTGEDAQTIEARLAITIDNIADPAWIQSVNDTATGIVIRTTGSTFTTSTLPNGEITSSTIPIINVLGDIGNVDTSGAAQHTVLAWEAISQTWVPKDAAAIVEKKSGLNVAVSGIGSTVLTVTVTGGIAQLDGSIEPFIISDGTNVLNVPEVPFLTGQRDDQVAAAIAAAIPAAAWIASVNTAANVITITSNGTNFTDTTIPVGDIDFPDIPVINKLSDIPDVDTSGIMQGDFLVWDQNKWVAVRPKGTESNVAIQIDDTLPERLKLTLSLPALATSTAGTIPSFILDIGSSLITIPPVSYAAGDSIQQILNALDAVVTPLVPSGTTTQIAGGVYTIRNMNVGVSLASGLKDGNIPVTGVYSPIDLDLADLNDVSGTPVTDDVLVYDGTTWSPKKLTREPAGIIVTKSEGTATTLTTSGTATADGQIDEFVIRFTDQATPTEVTITDTPFTTGETGDVIISRIAQKIRTATGALTVVQAPTSDTISINYTGPGTLIGDIEIGVVNNSQPGTSPPPVLALEDLTDVDTVFAKADDFLQFDGNNWIGAPLSVSPQNTGITFNALKSPGHESMFFNVLNGPAQADGEIPAFVVTVTDGTTMTTSTIGPVSFSAGDSAGTILNSLAAALDSSAIGQLPGMQTQVTATNVEWTDGSTPRKLLFTSNAPVGGSIVTNPPTPFTTTLRDLLDTDLTTIPATHGKALVYSANTQKWVPGEVFTNIDLTTPAEDKQVLYYDAPSANWKPINVLTDRTEVNTGIEVEIIIYGSNYTGIVFSGGPALADGEVPSFKLNGVKSNQTTTQTITATPFSKGDTVDQIAAAVYAKIQNGAIDNDPDIDVSYNANSIFFISQQNVDVLTDLHGGILFALNPNAATGLLDLGLDNLKDVVAFAPFARQVIAYDNVLKEWTTNSIFGDHISTGLEIEGTYSLSNFWIAVKGGTATHTGVIPAFEITRYDISKSLGSEVGTESFGPYTVNAGDSVQDVIDMIFPDIQGSALFATGLIVRKLTDSIIIYAGGTNADYAARYTTTIESGEISGGTTDGLYSRLLSLQEDVNMAHLTGSSEQFLHYDPTSQMWVPDELFGTLPTGTGISTTHTITGTDTDTVAVSGGPATGNGVIPTWTITSTGGNTYQVDPVEILTGDTSTDIATKLETAINAASPADFTISRVGDTISLQDTTGNSQANTLLNREYDTEYAKGIVDDSLYDYLNYKLFVSESATPPTQTGYYVDRGLYGLTIRDDRDPSKRGFSLYRNNIFFGGDAGDISTVFVRGKPVINIDETKWDFRGLRTVFRPLINPSTTNGFINEIVFNATGIHRWNGSQWQNVAWGGSAGASTLSGLTDVTLTTPVADDVLYYDGSDWVNTSMTLENIAGVTPEDNQVLVYSDINGGYVSKNIYGRNPQPGSATYLDVVVTPDGGGEGFVIEISESANHPNPGNGAVAAAIFPAFTINTGSNTYQVPATNVAVGDSPEDVIGKIRTAIVNAGYTGTDANEQIDPAAGPTNVIKVLYQTGFAATDLPEDVVLGGTPGIIKSIDDIPDVNAPTPNDGDVLSYNAATDEWLSVAPAGGASTIGALSDVDATTPADKQVLYWNAANSDWELANLVAKSGVAGTNLISSVNDIPEVDIDKTLTEDHLLRWDATNNAIKKFPAYRKTELTSYDRFFFDFGTGGSVSYGLGIKHSGSTFLTVIADNSRGKGAESKVQLVSTEYPDEDKVSIGITPRASKSQGTRPHYSFDGPRFEILYQGESPYIEDTKGLHIMSAKAHWITNDRKALYMLQGSTPTSSSDLNPLGPGFVNIYEDLKHQMTTSSHRTHAAIHTSDVKVAIMTDGDYIYVLGGNNQWKRVQLQTF